MTGAIEVTLLGFELEIVQRLRLSGHLPRIIERPRMGRIPAGWWESLSEDGTPFTPELMVDVGFEVERYEHQGMGIYRRTR